MPSLSPIPFREKNDILDFSCIPPGHYELNFRPPLAHPTGDIRKLVLRLWLVALWTAVAVFALLYALAPLLDSFAIACVVLGLSVAFLAANLVTDWCPTGIACLSNDRGTRLLILVSLPMLVWLIAVVFSRLDALMASSILLALVAIPVVLATADQITTHFVYWMSANPRVDIQTMRRWRAEWKERFRRFPCCPSTMKLSPQQQATLHQLFRLRNRYAPGFLLVALALFVPAPLVLFGRVLVLEIATGPTIIVGQLAMLVLVSLYRMTQAEGTLLLFCRALEHWFHYGQDRIYPPWVFHSPCGGTRTRRAYITCAIVLLAIALVPLAFTDAPSTSILSPSASAAQALLMQWLSLCHDILRPALESLLEGNLGPLMTLVAGTILATVAPLLYFLLASYIVAAPALAAHHHALDAPDALEQHTDWNAFDGYTYRLARSHNRHERNSMLMGTHFEVEAPVLLDIELLREHMHVLGPTGMGKTAITVSSVTIQAIRRGDGAVIVLDCKGDPALFHTTMIEAEKAGRKFKWFTNRLHRSTYVFNPFNQRYLESLTQPEFIGLFMMSLNLHHGSNYGRGWYSVASRKLFQTAVEHLLSKCRDQHAPIASFKELAQAIRELSDDKRVNRDALHLAFIIQSLAEFKQLNVSPRGDQNDPALRNAIQMTDVIRDRQVVYFSLTGATDVTSIGQIAQLANYSALSAAMAHRDLYGEQAKVHLICDEAHLIIGENIQNVLVQAREHGLACVLAHQTMSQLNPPGGPDLRELFVNSTCVKEIHAARDRESKRYISELSGQVGYFNPSWQQLPADVAAGRVSIDNASAQPGYVPMVGIRQEIGPRLTEEDIADINRHPNLSMITIGRNEGCSVYRGAFPLYSDWPISKKEYDDRHLTMPWPAGTDETIDLEPMWPPPNEHTIVPTHHPALTGPGDDPPTSEMLREWKREIDME